MQKNNWGILVFILILIIGISGINCTRALKIPIGAGLYLDQNINSIPLLKKNLILLKLKGLKTIQIEIPVSTGNSGLPEIDSAIYLKLKIINPWVHDLFPDWSLAFTRLHPDSLYPPEQQTGWVPNSLQLSSNSASVWVSAYLKVNLAYLNACKFPPPLLIWGEILPWYEKQPQMKLSLDSLRNIYHGKISWTFSPDNALPNWAKELDILSFNWYPQTEEPPYYFVRKLHPQLSAFSKKLNKPIRLSSVSLRKGKAYLDFCQLQEAWDAPIYPTAAILVSLSELPVWEDSISPGGLAKEAYIHKLIDEIFAP